MDDDAVQMLDAKATAYGLDLLQNDGGVDGIRNAVYVEIEPEIIRALLSHLTGPPSGPARRMSRK